MSTYGVIYKATSRVSGKSYIGQTTRDLEERIHEHHRKARKTRYPINRALLKYGESNFYWEVLCECPDQDELNQQELYFADLLNTWVPDGYNLRAGKGKGSMSDAERQKHAKTYLLLSPEGREVIIHNMNEFCRQNIDLSPSGMFAVFYGKKRQYKGWRQVGSVPKNTYYFLSPMDDKVEINNLKKFCRESPYSLDSSAMLRVYRGAQKVHKGWRIHPEIVIDSAASFGPKQTQTTRIKRSEKTSKEYVLLSPSGVPTYIKNMSQFCKYSEVFLAPSTMIAVYRGRKNSYKGWRRCQEEAMGGQNG